MNLDPLIRACQAAVGASVDGNAGPETWQRIYERLTGKPWQMAPGGTVGLIQGAVSARSEAVIATLLPEVQPYARALVHACARQGINIEVISGTRTYDEQNALYAKGRTKPGPIVTRARGGYSNHNFGLAFDCGLFQDGRYIEESPVYKAVGAIGKSIGLSWGGDWISGGGDEPHFELKPSWAKSLTENQMLARLRDLKDSGGAVFNVGWPIT